jgi:hypothetical protein
MSIKISELLAFIESVRTRETEKKKKITLSPLQLPEDLEIPVLERSDDLDKSQKPKRKRKQKEPKDSLLSVDPA